MPNAVIAVGRPGVGDSGRAPRKRKDYVGGRRSSWPSGRVEEDSGFHKAKSSQRITLHKLVFKECEQITLALFRYRYSTGCITEFAENYFYSWWASPGPTRISVSRQPNT